MLTSFQSIDQLTSTPEQGPLAVDSNAVHLWGIELDGTSPCLERCAGWLDEGERHRAARLVREEHRRHYVLAHGGLRAVLSKYLGISPDKIVLDRSATGKPFLTRDLRSQPAITFNLSHAHGRALIAISTTQEVGVDLERIRSDVEVTKLSARYFALSEHTSIMQATDDLRAKRFFRYWVAKEAVLKAQGIGLYGLTDCEIVLGSNELDAEVHVRKGSHLRDKVRVRLLSCGKGWEAAVAAPNLDSVQQCGIEQP